MHSRKVSWLPGGAQLDDVLGARTGPVRSGHVGSGGHGITLGFLPPLRSGVVSDAPEFHGCILTLPRSAALRAAAGEQHEVVELHCLRASRGCCGRDARAPARAYSGVKMRPNFTPSETSV